VTKHGFCDFEVGDDSVFERADGDNAAGGSAEHAFGVIAHGENFIGSGLYGDDGRFAENDAVVFNVDESICGPEIDADIAVEHAAKVFFKHGDETDGK